MELRESEVFGLCLVCRGPALGQEFLRSYYGGKAGVSFANERRMLVDGIELCMTLLLDTITSIHAGLELHK